MCYKCNNYGHIERNYKAPINKNELDMRSKAPICQLCKNFGHITRFCIMDMRNLNKNHIYRRNNNNRIHRRDVNRQREEIKEHAEEFKEIFVKAKELASSFVVVEEENFFDAHDDVFKLAIVFYSSYLN